MISLGKIIMLLVVAVLGVFVFTHCASMAQISEEIKEQNKILKEMVVCMQEQNNILKYNPMEEEK